MGICTEEALVTTKYVNELIGKWREILNLFFMQGPILASVFAVHELLKEGLLDVNVIFLIEGEEESGSHGFLEALTKHQVHCGSSHFALD